MRKIIISFIFIIQIPIFLIAQKDSIPFLNFDRPMQAESPYLMQKGFFQIETGARYINRQDPYKELQRVRLGATLLRYGVFPNFEIRLSDGYEYVHVQEYDSPVDSTESGIGPVTAGFKVLVVHEKGLRPEMSILGNITIRHFGDEAFRPSNSYPYGSLLCSHTITKKLSLSYNIGFSYSGEDADGFFVYSVYTGYYITKKLWVFFEAYGNFDHGDDPNNIDYSVNNLGDGGFCYRFRHNLQIDLTAGLAFDKHVERYFGSAGLSWRIPR